MRKRYIYDKNGNAVEVTESRPLEIHYVMPDIGRFRSMADGSVIEGRRQYENHLKKHGMRVVEPSEVATDKIMSYRKNYDFEPQQRKELIRAQVDAMSDKQFRQALRLDIDRIKWNSNF